MINHTGLTVSDLERSIDFYAALTGGRVDGPYENSGPAVDAVTGYPGVTVRQAFVNPPEGHAVIELLQYVGGSDVVLDPDNGSVGAVHVAIEVADLDAELERLAAAGTAAMSDPIVAGRGAVAGCRVVYVLDPDRIRVELVEKP
ncbi:VOC family protein [Enemella sp. A6]|uniref:VOC family protein n=1 Tax=Enemella sp. A6 TaxID=3440152 RepID=UPI003EBC7E23